MAPLSNLFLAENAGPQTVNLSGISLGAADQNQTLFIVASSSNPALVPHPEVTYTTPNATGTLVVRPAAYTSGTALITVTVDDGQSQNNTVSRQFTVTVNGVPTISIAPIQTADEDTVVPPIPFTIGDPETPVAGLDVTVSSSNPALVPNASLALAGTGANRSLTVTPLPNQSGIAFLELVVTDANDLKTTNGVYLFVRAVNDLPTLDPINPVTVYLHDGPVERAAERLQRGARRIEPGAAHHRAV